MELALGATGSATSFAIVSSGQVFSPTTAVPGEHRSYENFLDWQLDEAGYRFVRYANDFVVLCKNRDTAEEARDFVEQRISELGLQLSPETTSD